MNERLHELMMEATKDMPHCYYWPGEYVEKFAELLIRATMQEVEKYAESTDNFSMYECAAQVYPKFVELGVE